jgi:hypothetical protein
MYRELDARRVTETARQLNQRITERFAGSGLSHVSADLCALAQESEDHFDRLRRPHWPIRVVVGATVVLLLAVAVAAVLSIRVQAAASSLSDLVQGLEAAINDVIFLGLAIFFLLTVESRLKRQIALRGLSELRSIAHIIDMHQLTKDPDHIIEPGTQTPASPRRTMSRLELARYLDYCSELLAITSKLAALYLQSFSESVVLDSVNGIQALTVGLSGKIWQKIMILDQIAASHDRSNDQLRDASNE